jgi:hypothetical protein
MLMETEGDQWVYRRLPQIRGRVSTLGISSENGLPYLRPEIQLLFKARNKIEEKNQHDFELVLQHLSRESLQWLINSLSLQFRGGHEWIEKLRARVEPKM